MLNIVLFGPPGSGKGTQAEKLVAQYKLIHLSTGDILREEIQNKTEVGLKVQEYINQGALVPDQVVLEQLHKRAVKYTTSSGVIFDGFPRTIPQASMLDDMLGSSNISISIVIAIQVNDDDLIKRLVNRGIQSGRADDNEATIKNRLDVYKNQTLPLFDHYKAQGKLVSINGEQSVDEVFAAISKAIDAHKA